MTECLLRAQPGAGGIIALRSVFNASSVARSANQRAI